MELKNTYFSRSEQQQTLVIEFKNKIVEECIAIINNTMESGSPLFDENGKDIFNIVFSSLVSLVASVMTHMFMHSNLMEIKDDIVESMLKIIKDEIDMKINEKMN